MVVATTPSALKEQIIFPEINYDEVDEIRGMDIVICTTARTDDEARALLKGFDMPFARRDERGARRMAKKSAIEKNKHRRKLVAQQAARSAPR